MGLNISSILEKVSNFVGKKPDDLAVTIAARTRGPYATLVSTLLSLRARDEITQIVTSKILSLVPTPQDMVNLPLQKIEEIIYSTSFHCTKARTLQKICQQLLDRHNGDVPDTIEELLELHGIGRKCANLIITLGFNKPGICVDTHVFRITNRIGLVKAKNPEQTEIELRKILPKEWWIPINGVLIAFGRTHCTPISPKCSTCPIISDCKQIGVGKKR